MELTAIMNMVGGLVLCVGIVGAIPRIGKYLLKVSKFLGGFQVIIGIVVLILGVLNIGSLQGLVATMVGMILLTGVFYVIPTFGKYLERVGKFLGGFQTIIGMIAIVVGIWGLIA